MASNDCGSNRSASASGLNLTTDSETKTREVKFSHRWAIDNFAFYCYDNAAIDGVNGDGSDSDSSDDSSDSEPEDEQVENVIGGGGGGIEVNQVNNINDHIENANGNANGNTAFRCLRSVSFSSPVDDELKFNMELWPNGSREKYKDYVSVFLNFEPNDRQQVLVGFQFVILGDQDEIRYSDEFDRCQFNNRDSQVWGSYTFVPREFLLNPRNGLLPGGTLIVCCEIVYEEQIERVDIPKKQEVDKRAITQLGDDISSLLQSKAMADVVLVLGNEAEEMHAHKFLLGARSPVFAAMFEHDMEEKTKNRVILEDIQTEVMNALMKYIYLDEGYLSLMEEHARKLLLLADKYQIDLLKHDVEVGLYHKLSAESAVDYLLLADKCGATMLKRKAIEHLGAQILSDPKCTENKMNGLRSLLENQPKLFYEVLEGTIDKSVAIEAHNEVKRIFSKSQPLVFDSFSFTRSKVVRCMHLWNIEQFNTYDKNYYYYHYIGSTAAAVHTPIESGVFFSPLDDQLKFCLKLYPNGENACSKDYLSLYLCLKTSPANRRISVLVKVSILGASREPTYSKVIRKELGEGNQCGWPLFMYSDLLKRDKAGLFVNDGKLVVRCEVSYINDMSDQVRFSAHSVHPIRMDKDLAALLEKEKLTDITIVVGGKEFKAHKALLAARSPVFAAMLAANTPEDRLEIADLEADGFAELLQFIYCAKVDRLDEFAEKLLSLATQYQMKSLRSICEVFLCSKLSVETANHLLILAHKHDAAQLKAKTIEFITGHLSSALKNDGFKVILQDDPKLFAEIFNL